MRALRPLFIAACAVCAVPARAEAPSGSQRYAVEAWYDLPVVQTWRPLQNRVARVRGVYLRMVLDCASDGGAAARWQCRVEDAAVSALGVDAGEPLAEVLAHLDGQLTGGTVELQHGPRGNLLKLDLNDVPRDSQFERVGWVVLHGMVERAAAGFDAPRAPDGEESWAMQRTRLAGYPVDQGTLSKVKGRCAAVEAAAASDATARCEAKVVLRPSESTVTFAGKLEATEARFEEGRLRSRTWMVRTAATAGTVGNVVGLGYHQVGSIDALGPAEQPDLGASAVIDGPPPHLRERLDAAQARAVAARGTPDDPGTFAWVASGGGVRWRPGADLGAGGEVAGGVRLRPGIWLGGRLVREGEAVATTAWGAVPWSGWAVAATAAWQPDYRVAPTLGVSAGVATRRLGPVADGRWTTGLLGATLGVSTRLARPVRLDLLGRAQAETATARLTHGIFQDEDLSRLEVGGVARLTWQALPPEDR